LIGAEALVRKLEIDTYFTVPGRFAIPLNISLKKVGARRIMIPDERCAGHAADGYARASGKPAGLIVSAGPGALNATLSVATAFRDYVPMVVIAGDVPTRSRGSLAVEEVDLMKVFEPLCKNSIYVDCEERMVQALDVAGSSVQAPKGPVFLDFPLDVQEREVELGERPRRLGPQIGAKELEREVSEVAKLLEASKRPLILVGNGCVDAHKAAVAFAEAYNIPVAYTLMGWCAAWPKPSVEVGFCGIRGFKTANNALRECDFLLALGARLSEATIAYGVSEGSIIAQVLVEGPFSEGATLRIRSRCEDFVEALYKSYGGGRKDFWVRHEGEPLYDSKTFKVVRKLVALDEFSIIALDVGQSTMWALEALKHGWRGPVLYPGGLATMGFSIPAAIGAQLTRPQHRVLSITGDGGAIMNLPALHAISVMRLPIVVAVFNNESYGMVRSKQLRDYGSASDVELGFRGFQKVAEAVGMRYLRVESEEELRGLSQVEAPLLIEVKVEVDDAPPTPKKLFSKS
jgi:acetolactate synthase-1/2/3 large subunit